MAAKLSKEVTDRIRACLFVLSAFITEGPAVARALLGIHQPHLEEGDEAPGYDSVLNGLYRSLRAALARLSECDAKVSQAAAAESHLRRKYNNLSETMGQLIIALRRTVIGQYVDPDIDNLGLQSLDARDSITVARRAVLIFAQFSQENLDDFLGQRRFSTVVDVRKLVDEIREMSNQLLELTEQINQAKRRTSAARAEKKEAMNGYDRIFLRSARIFEDLCRYAGQDILADQVRPSTTRPGRTVQEPDDVADDVLDQIGELPFEADAHVDVETS